MSRPRAWSLALLTVVGLHGCKADNGHSQPPDPKTVDTAATPEAPPESARFWVAGEGLAAYDLDGKPVARVGTTGDWARRLADGRIVVYYEQPAGRVALLDANGEVVHETLLPIGYDPETCAPTMPEQPTNEDGGMWGDLQPQEPRAFAVDLASGHTCLLLQDRNDNMADLGLLVAVALSDGSLSHEVSLDINGVCEAKGNLAAGVCADELVGEPWIESWTTPRAAETWPFAFDEASHSIRKDGNVHSRVCAEGASDDDDESWGECAEPESASPSGRWLLLSGRISEGDYIHRDLVLFDRSNGKLWQIIEDDSEGARYVEVTPAEIFAETETLVLSVVGESEIEWLADDRLWVDGRLLIPERQTVVMIGGTLVYTS